MVSDLIAGGAIALISSLAGAIATGLYSMRRARLEQSKQDERLVAEKLATKEAELLFELSHQLTRCHRIYLEGVANASKNRLTQEEYREEYEESYRDLQETIEQMDVFFSEFGSAAFNTYLSHIYEVEAYMAVKSDMEPDMEPRDGNPRELIETDEIGLSFDEWQTQYEAAKGKLSELVHQRLLLLEAYEEK